MQAPDLTVRTAWPNYEQPHRVDQRSTEPWGAGPAGARGWVPSMSSASHHLMGTESS